MKKRSAAIGFLFLLGILTFTQNTSWAGEHGGSAMCNVDGSATGAGMSEKDEVATLRQAAKELKATNPELAEKLEILADQHKA